MDKSYRSSGTGLLAVFAGLMISGPALGAGYQVFPTASSTARLLAGNGILGEEAGDMYFNAAGLSLQPSSRTVQLGASWLRLKTRMSDLGSYRSVLTPAGRLQVPISGNANEAVDTATPIGGFYSYRSPDRERLTWGLGLTSPYGVQIDYGPAWTGRYQAVTSELKVLDLNGAFAWQANDRWSVGAGISVQYADATLSQAVPTAASIDALAEVNGDSTGYGFNAGLIYNFSPVLKLGASYRSMVSHEIDGERTTTLGGTTVESLGAVAKLHIPEFVLLSFHYSPAGQPWSLAGGLRHTSWSRFEELQVDYADGTSSVVAEGWEGSWTSSLSLDYELSARDKLIVSYAYDESPVPNAALRSARIPDSHRNIVGLGYERKQAFCEACTLYFGYHRTMLGESEIDREEVLSPAFSTRLHGRFEKASTNVYAAHLVYSF